MADPPRDPRAIVTLIITITVCLFVLVSLLGAYLLTWAGKDAGEVWGKAFDLVQILAGAVVGYAAGTYSVRSTVTTTAEPAAATRTTVTDDDEEGT